MPKTIDICMPTYNGSKWIKETFSSIFNQSFQDYRIIISDDNSTDDTLEVISSIKDKRIKVYRNLQNLGYGRNLQQLRKLSSADIIFLMGQDDILLKDALLKTYNAFSLSEEIGAVTRPYYWFDEDLRRPVRAVLPYSEEKDAAISVLDGKKETLKIFESVGQLSGLAYRRQYMDTDFHSDVFPAHIYPFAAIAKKYKIVFLKDFTIAVRIASSQTRLEPRIYSISPVLSWVEMFNDVYKEPEYAQVRRDGIEQICTHFMGLVQLKNYSTYKNLLREILIMAKLWPKNLLNIQFWFFLWVRWSFPAGY
ncbi:MAG: glycosyltransferase family 2 protein [Candidatus Omnitrophica bacterium]|nr:glycosyltransferase family 2 protein [Candidatus Omnitrophota bacterium]